MGLFFKKKEDVAKKAIAEVVNLKGKFETLQIGYQGVLKTLSEHKDVDVEEILKETKVEFINSADELIAEIDSKKAGIEADMSKLKSKKDWYSSYDLQVQVTSLIDQINKITALRKVVEEFKAQLTGEPNGKGKMNDDKGTPSGPQ